MERRLMYAGIALLLSTSAYALYSSATNIANGSGMNGVPGLILTLGIVLSISGAALQEPAQRKVRQILVFSGCGLVATYVSYGLYTSAEELSRNPNLANVFGTVGMMGMLLVLGATALQRSRA
jgi:drug/metabolite transporter (DMT)-like permease